MFASAAAGERSVAVAAPVLPEPQSDDDVFARLNDLVESDVWVAIGKGLLVALAVLWLGSIYATYKDARRRVHSPLLVGAAVWLATVLPFVGAWLYRRLRPAQVLDEVWTRRLEIRALEHAMERAQAGACPACAAPAAHGFLVCPGCGERLRRRCAGCGKPLELRWTTCPWCEHPATPAATKPGTHADALPPEQVRANGHGTLTPDDARGLRPIRRG